jgi:Ca2+-binding EF-hand superfamily protein
VNKIWKDYDKDNSGQLSFDESKVFISDSFGGSVVMKDSDLKKMFDKIDTDGDGLINKGEMAVFLLKLTKF